MKIDKILLIGIVSLSFLIVAVTTGLLTNDMLRMAKGNLTELNGVSSSVKEQNEAMFKNLSKQASDVNDNIFGITERAAIEQLRNVGNGIAEEIKAVMNIPFATTQALGRTILFQKADDERRGETPSRKWVENYFLSFLQSDTSAQALFSCWEKDAFDGKDAEFVGKENADEDMDIGNENYVSEGAFLPWFYKSQDEKTGEERIVRGFTDDYLISDYNYYTTPRDTKKEFITEPYVDGGIPITSFCVPLLKDDRFLGIVGIDVALDKLQDIVEKRKPFVNGFAMFFSPGGKIVYYPDPKINYEETRNVSGEIEMDYRDVDSVPALAETARLIKEEKPVIYTSKTLPGREGTEMLIIHVPVQFGDYPAQWTVAVAAPANRVMSSRDHAKRDMDEMVQGIEFQNEEFVKQLDSKISNAVTVSENAKSQSFWRSVVFAAIVLIFSSAVGSYFAVCVNRSIGARDFRYRQILDASSDPISVVDMNMKIVFLNKPALELLKKSLDECLGRSVEEIWKSVIGDDYDRCGLRVLQTRSKNQSHVAFSDVDWDVTSDYILESRGDKDGMVEIFKDVSDRENVFRLIEQVNDLIKSTAQETNNIAQAASELSRGAEQQAESVESITGDMKSTNEQTLANADNARQADKLSVDAGKAAALGQKRMQEMVEAMNQISDNAKNMQAVIKTIDDIAFQTNLLALNAAVEAARAGTHGKGFAVVAEEVRNLASRSAKAAKETEELIIKSNSQIEGGVSVADQTAEALNAIAGHVAEVSTLIERIVSASREQTTGVNRMTATLQSVDQVTRQNVDLATTTANATQQLSSEVSELQKLMQSLKKDEA